MGSVEKNIKFYRLARTPFRLRLRLCLHSVLASFQRQLKIQYICMNKTKLYTQKSIQPIKNESNI